MSRALLVKNLKLALGGLKPLCSKSMEPIFFCKVGIPAFDSSNLGVEVALQWIIEIDNRLEMAPAQFRRQRLQNFS